MAPHGGTTRGSAQPAKKRARPAPQPPQPAIVFERDELSDDSGSSAASSESPLRRPWRQPQLVAPHLLRRAGGSDTPRRGSRGAGPSSSPGTRTFELDELDSTDEDADPDSDDDAEPGRAASGQESGGHDYQMFLRAVLGEGATPEENAIPDGSASELKRLLDAEDDFDFDYLRESALVPDDPFEYRDDRGVHVSRKEVVQLYSTGDSALRPRTRRAAPSLRLPPGQKLSPSPPALPYSPPPQFQPMHGSPHAQVSQLPPQQLQLLQAVPQPLPLQSAQRRRFAQSQSKTPSRPAQSRSGTTGPAASASGASPAVPQKVPRPPQAIREQDLALLREQYLIHVHLLAAVHADASHILASSPISQPRPERAIPEARVALAKTTELANALIRMRDTATEYWRMLSPYQVAHARAVSSGEVFTGTHNTEENNYHANSLFDTPGISCLPAFMDACRAMTAGSAPLAVVRKKLGPYLHPQIAKKLTSSPVRLNLSSALKDGEHPWTAADDQLLALTLRKHTREFGALAKDLLPHRTQEDCAMRVRYLSSRRCGENPVKRHVNFNNTPLSKEEMRAIQHCLQAFGEGAEQNNNVWKAIQRDYLPGRDWSFLQKLWHIRETRRKYKASYRKKVKAQGGVDSSPGRIAASAKSASHGGKEANASQRGQSVGAEEKNLQTGLIEKDGNVQQVAMEAAKATTLSASGVENN